MKRIVTGRRMKEMDQTTIREMGIPSCVLMAVSYTHLDVYKRQVLYFFFFLRMTECIPSFFIIRWILFLEKCV